MPDRRAMTVAAFQLCLDLGGDTSGTTGASLDPDPALDLLGRAKADGAELLVLPLLPDVGPPEEFSRRWSESARKIGVFLAVGRMAGGGVNQNVGYLFGPDGSLPLKQAQTHLTKSELEAGIVAGTDLDLAELPCGRVGFAVGTDCWYPEVNRILALRGADVILAPVAVSGPYGFWRQAAGLWEEVQQNQVFGIEAGLELPGRFEGRTAVMAPVEVTPGETGYLAHVLGPAELMDEGHATSRSEPTGAAAFVTARIDPAMLEKARKGFPIFHFFNVPLYRRWFPGIYEGGTRR